MWLINLNRRRVIERFYIRRIYKTWYPHATVRKNAKRGLLKTGQSRGHQTGLQNGNGFVERSELCCLDSKMGVGRRRARRSEKEPEPSGKMMEEAKGGGASLKCQQCESRGRKIMVFGHLSLTMSLKIASTRGVAISKTKQNQKNLQ